jgi:hypothetical protein
MPSKASMTQPTENIPTDRPVWHGPSPFPVWSKRALVIRTSRIEAWHQLTDQRQPTLEAVDVSMAIRPHVHPTPTFTTPRVLNFQDEFGPSQILWHTTSPNDGLLATTSGGNSLPRPGFSTNRNPNKVAGD